MSLRTSALTTPEFTVFGNLAKLNTYLCGWKRHRDRQQRQQNSALAKSCCT